MASNPFRPSFGVTPPVLVGRDTEILAFGDALDAGPGAPGRATLYTGVRGIGKTVMLNEAETQARQRGWVVVSETAVPGLIDRLTAQRLPEAAAALELSSTGRRVTAVAFPFHLGGLTWQPPAAEHRPDLRAQLTALTDHLADHGTGLLLTVDELHRADRAGLRELASTIQHLFREERAVAFAGAGLPTAIADLLNDDVLTFLRRADRYQLGDAVPPTSPTLYEPRWLPRVTGSPTERLRWRPPGQVDIPFSSSSSGSGSANSQTPAQKGPAVTGF